MENVSSSPAHQQSVIKIIFWNCRGRINIDDLQNYVTDSVIVCVYETWCEEKLNKLIMTKWQEQEIIFNPAIRNLTKGRAKGGIAVFHNNNIYNSEVLVNSVHAIVSFYPKGNIKIVLGTIYISPSIELETILNDLRVSIHNIVHKYSNEIIIIGGDFNSRIGNENQIYVNHLFEGTNLLTKRQSNDTELNKRGIALLDFMEEAGFLVINGRAASDMPAQYTYVSSIGNSVNDLIWVYNKSLESVIDLKILQIPTHSDHFPVLL